MSPRIGWVILASALWLAGSAVAAQEACGAPAGAGPRIEAATPVVVRTEGATACVCGAFPDRAALEGLRIGGRPVAASADEFGRVATLRLPPDLPPGRHEVSGAPEAGYGPEDRAEVQVIELHARRCEKLFSCGRHRRVCVRVEGAEERVALRVRNAAPELVALFGGNVQEVRTSGGARNRAAIEGRATGLPGRWTLDIDPATAPCPCAAGGPDGIPPERVAELEACLAAAVSEIEAWFDERAEELAARAARGALRAPEVIALLDELEERFLRVLATPDLAALRAWVEDELARERGVWARAPAAPVPAAARATSGYALAAGGGPGAPPPILRAQAEASQGFGAFLNRMATVFDDLWSVSNDLTADLCVRAREPGGVAWLHPKAYPDGRLDELTHAEFENLTRGKYVGEVTHPGSDNATSIDANLVQEPGNYLRCAPGAPLCQGLPRPAGFECQEAGRP